jgi:hypothetical protein
MHCWLESRAPYASLLPKPITTSLTPYAPSGNIGYRISIQQRLQNRPTTHVQQKSQWAADNGYRLAEVYRERVSELIAELQAEDSEGLRTRLRTLVDEIRLVPADGGLRVEVRGALGGILRLASGDAPGQMAGAVPDMFDLQFKMDAGTRNHLDLLLNA